MSGKYYNGAIYIHKAVYEGLQRLCFEAFLESLDEQQRDSIKWFTESMYESIKDVRQSLSIRIQNIVYIT